MVVSVAVSSMFKLINLGNQKNTCTHLFQKGVDPHLIKEQAGHKSNMVMRYKKSNLNVKKKKTGFQHVVCSLVKCKKLEIHRKRC